MSGTARPERTGRWARLRGPLLLAALALSAVTASAAASASLSSPPPAPTGLEQHLQAEIDAMRAAGLPADHPKVRALQASLDQLRDTARVRPQRDPQGDAA